MRTFYSYLFYILFLFSASHVWSASGEDQLATPVPMMRCENTSSCVYSSQFPLNDALNVDQWMYFSFDLSTLDYTELDGLVVTLQQLSPLEAAISWYLQKGHYPTEFDFVDRNNYTCYDYTCPSSSGPSSGMCNPEKTVWYLGVYNNGIISANFSFNAQIKEEASELLGCDYVWRWNLILGFLVLPIICLLLSCFLLCAVCACKEERKEKYSKLKVSEPIAATYVAQPYQLMHPTYVVPHGIFPTSHIHVQVADFTPSYASSGSPPREYNPSDPQEVFAHDQVVKSYGTNNQK